ncbi:SPOSA6832_02944 [Sporobolomyces salmonicolor]|uniref:Mediator of RNA polymerase II transcription subunit 31 n=1 Tax=Sporidiobolus salmonicolor TaxID=5005 RepID=A0A0D6EMJ4_SPOSA|nr:SPOSA6832_02944 [Sporobolomyces salmonicolor]
MAAPAPSAPTQQERDSNRARFETELEFVQCLANPFYLQREAPVSLCPHYLQYLLYFRRPQYSRFLQYPQALHHLELLTAPGEKGNSFRKALKEQPLLVQELAGRQVAHWAGWREREGAAVSGGGGKVEDGEGTAGGGA